MSTSPRDAFTITEPHIPQAIRDKVSFAAYRKTLGVEPNTPNANACLDTYAVHTTLDRIGVEASRTVLAEIAGFGMTDCVNVLTSGDSSRLLPPQDLEKILEHIHAKWEDQGRMRFPVSSGMANFLTTLIPILLVEDKQHAKAIRVERMKDVLPKETGLPVAPTTARPDFRITRREG